MWCNHWVRGMGLGLLCAVALASARAADGDYATPDHPANHRGKDQTGVFPARGLALTFDEGQNVRWKTPLPNLGMGTPVVVGDLVFVSCDPGWTADCPLLVAVNRVTGAIAWQAALDNLDGPQWTEQERTEGKRLRTEEYRYLRRANELTWALRQAGDDAARAALKAKADEEGLVCDDRTLTFGYAREHARTRGYQTLVTRGYLRHEGWSDNGRYFTGQTMPSVVSDGARVYAHTNTNAVACFDMAGARLWINDTCVPFGSGILTASPCLVGDILVLFVPRSAGVTAIGYDKVTGAERWRQVLAPSCYLYSPGSTPVPLNLGGTPAVYVTSGHVLRVSDGKVLGRLEHPAGAALVASTRPETHFGNYGNSVGRGDRLFVTHGSYGNATPGVFAYTLRLDGEALVSTLRWSIVGTRASVKSYQHLILDGDRVICADMDCIADAETGRVLTSLNGAATMDPGPITADDLLIVVDRYTPKTGPRAAGASQLNGCDVRMLDATTLKRIGAGHLEVDPPGGEKTRQRVARTCRDTWGWGGDTWGGQQCLSSPVADGDCLFLRSNDNLYCIRPEARGSAADDPAEAARIRAMTEAADLVPYLAAASACYRYEAARRLGALPALPDGARAALARLAAADPSDEVRGAAFAGLNGGDPRVGAGWAALAATFAAAYPAAGRVTPDMQERRQRLYRLFRTLGPEGKGVLTARWAALPDGSEKRGLGDIAAALGWQLPPA